MTTRRPGLRGGRPARWPVPGGPGAGSRRTTRGPRRGGRRRGSRRPGTGRPAGAGPRGHAATAVPAEPRRLAGGEPCAGGAAQPGPAGFPCAVRSGRRTAGDGRSSRRPRPGRPPPGARSLPRHGRRTAGSSTAGSTRSSPAAPGRTRCTRARPGCRRGTSGRPGTVSAPSLPRPGSRCSCGLAAGRVPGPAHLRAAAGTGRHGAWA